MFVVRHDILLGSFQEVAQAFILSLGRLSADELVKVASDGAGSWVVEAFLDCKTNFKPKEKLIRKLVGHYELLATSPGGCHVVDKCFSLAVGSQSFCRIVQYIKICTFCLEGGWIPPGTVSLVFLGNPNLFKSWEVLMKELYHRGCSR